MGVAFSHFAMKSSHLLSSGARGKREGVIFRSELALISNDESISKVINYSSSSVPVFFHFLSFKIHSMHLLSAPTELAKKFAVPDRTKFRWNCELRKICLVRNELVEFYAQF